LLLCADVIGVAIYRKHASWPHLIKLFPWVLVGIVAGYFALGKLTNAHMQKIIGGILLGMTALHLWRGSKEKRRKRSPSPRPSPPGEGESLAAFGGYDSFGALAASFRRSTTAR
jgi:hypothetical protein